MTAPEPRWRPPTSHERALIADHLAMLRGNLERALAGEPRVGLLVAWIGLLLMPVFFFIPYKDSDGPGMRWALMGLCFIFFVMGFAGWRSAAARLRQRLADFDAMNAPRLERVQEWSFSPQRVLAVTDGDGFGFDWWLFKLGDHWLVLHDEGPTFEVELGNLYWREQVTLSLDSAGVPLGMVGEGKAVPFHDTRLQPPDFQVTEKSGAWSPAEGREEAILFTDAEVRAGEWPPGVFD